MLRMIYIVIAPIEIAKAVINVSFVYIIKLSYSSFKRLYIALNNAPPGSRGMVDGKRIIIAGALNTLAIISLYISIQRAEIKTEKKMLYLIINNSYIPLEINAPKIIRGILLLPIFSVIEKPRVPKMDNIIFLSSKYNHRCTNSKSNSKSNKY